MFKDLFNKLRDARRVRRYIKRHYWYDSFKRILSNRGLVAYLSFIYGFQGKYTILNAFVWKNTIQGEDYWSCVNYRFMIWYKYGEE